MKNIYLPTCQKILLFCVLLLSSQFAFAQALPPPINVTPSTTICYGDIVTLSAECGGAQTIWFDKDSLEVLDLDVSPTETTFYTVICACSCFDYSTEVRVDITVNVPYNVTRNQVLCTGNSIELKASCPIGTPKWFIGDTITPLGGTSTVVQPTGLTDYFVQCEASGGTCQSPFSQVIIDVNSTPNLAPTGFSATENICTGSSITLSATCDGAATLFLFEEDETTEILSLEVRPTVSPTIYKIRCEDGTDCPSPFETITVTLTDLPQATIAPMTTTICKGDAIALDASCTSGLTVAWYAADGTTALAGTVITPSADMTTYKVRCEDTSIDGCVSEFDSITIEALSYIIAQPQSVLVCLGDKVKFTVETLGATSLHWQKKQDNGVFIDIPSATTDSLVIDSTVLADRGYYRCHVVGTCDFYTEEAFLAFPQTILSKNKLAPAQVTAMDLFGKSIALSDSLAIVGAPYRTSDSFGDAKGAAFIFKMNPNGKWSQMAMLAPSDLQFGDSFGTSVAIAGNFAFVGAPGQDNLTGSVYVFKKQLNNTWTQSNKLIDTSGVSGDIYGMSMAALNDYLVVGQPGYDKIFIYKRNIAGVYRTNAEFQDGSSSNGFGTSVGISEKAIVVGAPGEAGTGAIFIYERDILDIWNFKDQRTPDNMGLSAAFGISSAIGGSTIVATGFDVFSGESIVQLYERDATGNWQEKTQLTTEDLAGDAGFGISLAVHDNIVVVGAPGNFVGRGAAVVFEKNAAGDWVQKKVIIPTDLIMGDQYGSAVAINKNTIIVGAAFDIPYPTTEVSKGGAYFYNLFTYPIPVVSTITQASAVCPAQKGTFNLTGLPSVDPYTITYKIDSAGTEKTAIVTPDSTGKASFMETLVWANNEKSIFITKIKNNTTDCQHIINVPAEITLKAPTEITDPPILQTVCVGETAVFMAEATGEGILTFQWQRQAPATSSFTTPLTNGFADISVLTLPNRPVSDNGARYRVKVTGECGVATSSEAVLTVLPKGSASISTGGPICSGTAGTLVFLGTPHAQVFYQSNGTTVSTILDENGESVVSSGILTEETSFSLVSLNIGGKCEQILSGSAKIEILASGTNPPLVLTSPANDILANGVQTHTAQTIEATNKIEPSGKTTNIGNNYVLMKPGFEAKQGSVFLAKITGACI